MPRPSSALKPSHSPDSVACSGLGGICLAFDETLHYVVASLWPMHGVIVSVLLCVKMLAYTLHSASFQMGVASIFFDGV